MLPLSNSPNPFLQNFPVPEMKFSMACPPPETYRGCLTTPTTKCSWLWVAWLVRLWEFAPTPLQLTLWLSCSAPRQHLSSFRASIQVLNFPCCIPRDSPVHTTLPFRTDKSHVGTVQNGKTEVQSDLHRVRVRSGSGSWPWESAESLVEQSELQLPHSTPRLNTSRHEQRVSDYTLRALTDMLADPPWQRGDSMTAYCRPAESQIQRTVPLKSNPQKWIKNDYHLLESFSATCLLCEPRTYWTWPDSETVLSQRLLKPESIYPFVSTDSVRNPRRKSGFSLWSCTQILPS